MIADDMDQRWLSDEEQRAWSAYVLASRVVNRAVDRDLKLSHDLISDDFSVLELLAEQPEGRMRFGELAAQLHFPKAHLTYRFQRLESQGLVARERCEDDGRGAYARITIEGHDMLRSAAPVHVESVRRHLFDHLDPELVAQLESAMSAVLQQQRPVDDDASDACPDEQPDS
jgi:DNA-binding MarR family transcriptional regulator